MNKSAPRAILFLAIVGLAVSCGGQESQPEPRPPSPAPAPAEAWRWEAPRHAGVGMPAADDGDIAFTYGHTYLVLLDASGRERWQAEHLGVRDVAPVLTAETVVAATDDGVVAFDRTTGAARWQATIGERPNTPAIAAGHAVVSTWDGSLVALGLADGRVAWRVPIGGGALGPAAAAGDVVVTSWETERGTEAGMTTVDAATGQVRWSVPLTPGGVSAPALVGSDGEESAVAIAVDGRRRALALELGSGGERWQAPLEGAGSPEVPPLALAGGQVLVAHRLGGVTLFDDRGTAVWRASSDGAAVRGGPAGPGPNGRFALPLDEGRVLVAGPDGAPDILDPPGLVSGVARAPAGELLVATNGRPPNVLVARPDW